MVFPFLTAPVPPPCCLPAAFVPPWAALVAFRILAPQAGLEPVPSAVAAQSPNHWTAREFPARSHSGWAPHPLWPRRDPTCLLQPAHRPSLPPEQEIPVLPCARTQRAHLPKHFILMCEQLLLVTSILQRGCLLFKKRSLTRLSLPLPYSVLPYKSHQTHHPALSLISWPWIPKTHWPSHRYP